jgi:hypothetical protein
VPVQGLYRELSNISRQPDGGAAHARCSDVRAGRDDGCRLVRGRVVQWTGHAWHNTGTPGCGNYFWLAVLSAKDVWAFGDSRCAARYDGGGAPCRCPRCRIRPTATKTPVRSLRRARMTGRRWVRAVIPYATSTLAGMVKDGHGGFWLLAGYGHGGPTYQRFYHYANGRWTRTIVPAPSGQSPSTLDLGWIPGTRSAWAVASIGPNNDPSGYGQAVIYKYGP